MVRPRREEVTNAIRNRIHRALQIGAISPGDRLPGTRELSRELHVDPRVVSDAYRALAVEGLVEFRERSGAYVSPSITLNRDRPEVSVHWLAELFAQGIARGVSATELPETMSAALGRRLRAIVIATTVDQTEGICRELRTDFGLNSRGLLAEMIVARRELPRAIHRAHLLVTTELHRNRVRAMAERLGKRFVSMTVRPDLYETEWALLRGQEAYVVVADVRFGRLVRDFIRSAGAVEPVHILIAGKDDIARVPDDAPVYVTQAARARIGSTRMPAGLMPPARMISDDCAREIMTQVLLAARG
ncbi:MAG: GntR family transcriptional regulator [Gemmatimonadaceae bacterium]